MKLQVLYKLHVSTRLSHPQAMIGTMCVHKVFARILGSQKGLHIYSERLSNCIQL